MWLKILLIIFVSVGLISWVLTMIQLFRRVVQRIKEEYFSKNGR